MDDIATYNVDVPDGEVKINSQFCIFHVELAWCCQPFMCSQLFGDARCKKCLVISIICSCVAGMIIIV